MHGSTGFFASGPGRTARKQLGKRFWLLSFLVLNLFTVLQWVSNSYFKEKV